MRYSLEDSVEIAAPAEAVYQVVSDVTRTGDWSPVCKRVEWDSDARGVGAMFTGYNEKPDRKWKTRSCVVADTPGREFRWRLEPGGVVWGYVIEPSDSGCVLTEFTHFTDVTEALFTERYGTEAADEETRTRLMDAATGIPSTLAKIKAIVECDRSGSTR